MNQNPSSPPLQWIDSHTHLDYEYAFDTKEYLSRAKQAGVVGVITIGAARQNWHQVQTLAESFPEVHFTVGIHPHDAKDFNDDVAAEIRAFAAHPKCVAVGEVGLDYHYEHSPREVQIEACRRQLALALELRKPVSIHSRDGEDDLLPLLADFSRQWRNGSVGSGSGSGAGDRPPGVIHCFSGSVDFAQGCLDADFYLSFSGILTFKKAEDVRAAAMLAPLDRILVETDSPYLAPVPYRGKSNESAYMIETCKALAFLKGIGLETLSRATRANTRAVFGIDYIK